MTGWFEAAEAYGSWLHRNADAEQAKSTGGMLAIYPTQECAAQLVIPGGEPIEDLHLTLLYFGQDVTGFPGADQDLARAASSVVNQFGTIEANVFGHAIFNPNDQVNFREPCAVYLVGNSPDFAQLHTFLEQEVGQVWDLSEQHRPWIPHITAGYSRGTDELFYSGPIQFDRIGLEWAGNTTTFPLTPQE